MKRLAKLTLVLSCALPAAAAQAAPPNPFGHACAPRHGVLFCPTASDAERVASFDGVPLDVDVTLPATGDGPFPTIALLHGYGGTKSSFQGDEPAGASGYDDVFYASRGYAVITPSARGFGRSCGVPDSRTAPACDRGWIHLDDQRYEGRDVQHLLGLLVDQGVAKPGALGVSGVSYGGIITHSLARLRDRVRLPSGAYQRWRSPGGRPLEIAAAWPIIGATDLTYSLTPNGRFLDFGPFSPNQSRVVGGVPKQSYNNGLYVLGDLQGFYAPAGADRSADIRNWKAISDRGEPYRADARAVARELSTYHSAVGVSGTPAPLLVQNGWTDDLFPVPEAIRGLRMYEGLRDARVSLQLADLGHSRGSNKAKSDRFFEAQGARFFDAYLKDSGRPPAHRSVTAFTQTCPADAPDGGPFRARSWAALHPDSLTAHARARQRVTSGGGNPDTAKAYDQVLSADACLTVPRERAGGTAIAQTRVRRPFTLLGLPTVRASHRHPRPRRHARRAALGRTPRAPAAGGARRAASRGRPGRTHRLPAVRQRLALRSRTRGEARAARQRSRLLGAEQLPLLGAPLATVGEAARARGLMAGRSPAGLVVAITGAARGIGQASAAALARAGARVALGDLDGDLAAAAAEPLAGARGFALDVTSSASFTEFLDATEAELGPLDVLVNNAGIMWVGPFLDEPEEVALRQFDVNVHGVLRGMKLALPRMQERGRGQIVNIASVASKLPPAGEASYAATKHAVYGYSAAAREELRGHGIDLSVVMPVVVETELAAGTGAGRRDLRLTPEQVADAVLDAIARPRFECFVPRSVAALQRLHAVLPQRGRDLLYAAMMPDQVEETDQAARADYERRTGIVGP